MSGFKGEYWSDTERDRRDNDGISEAKMHGRRRMDHALNLQLQDIAHNPALAKARVKAKPQHPYWWNPNSGYRSSERHQESLGPCLRLVAGQDPCGDYSVSVEVRFEPRNGSVEVLHRATFYAFDRTASWLEFRRVLKLASDTLHGHTHKSSKRCRALLVAALAGVAEAA